MNGKQLGLLFALLVVLGGAGLLIEHSRNQAVNTVSQGAGGKLLGDSFPVNDVAHIRIKQDTNELNLVKKDDLWRVAERDNYPANFSQISDFLLKVADVKIVESDPVTPSDLSRLQLAPAGQGTNSGLQLDFLDKDGKTIRALILGKPHVRKSPQRSPTGESGDTPNGRYVMLAGGTQDALTVGDPLDDADPKPEAWLNKDFFKIERRKQSLFLTRRLLIHGRLHVTTESGAWKFLDPAPDEHPDTNKLTGVANPFAAPSFEDVFTASAKSEETGLDRTCRRDGGHVR